nr:GIY-YIG nuclease family protein [Bradyrhizobium japonicum]
MRLVVPGWSEGPDPEPRDSGFALRAPRNDGWEGLGNHGVLRHILASRRDGAIYVGITNDLVRRVYEHRIKAVPSFTTKYNITRLVWFEAYDDPISAISREKELKKWKRAWKTQLIEKKNPNWDDLYESICN